MVGLNGLSEDPHVLVQHLDEIGGPNSYNHFPVGWAWAMNTPFQWGKQIASHFGGTRNPLVISWPAKIKDAGGVRWQFHHVIDLAPTIFDAAHIQHPIEVNGVKQKPIEGVSMVYTFADANAKGTRRTQYFEMFGNRAIYNDGWLAACRHGRLPWENAGSYDFSKDVWELYDVDHDFSEDHNVAAQYPDKLKQLQALFLKEARKYQVLPLDDRFIERADPSLRPSLISGRTEFTYYAGAYRIPESSSPNVKNRSHTITAYVNVPKTGGDGTLIAAGGVVGGYALYVKDGKPVYEYNYLNLERFRVVSSEQLSPGPATIRVEFKYDGGGLGKGGTVTLFVNDKQVAQGRVEKTIPGRFSADETFDTGMDTGSPVGSDYESPNRYSGTIKKVEVNIEPGQLTEAEERTIREMQRRAAMAAQ
jgi:arylsulfatase